MNYKIAIIGLGYVGLPLAMEFSKKYSVVGFDIKNKRINDLNNFYDETNECDQLLIKKLLGNNSIKFTYNINEIKDCNVFIITVPTPIDKFKKPDLNPLINASKQIGKIIKKNDYIIYESTVYPGCTEEVCIPILEKESKLKLNLDFNCGYSPERINPGDKINTITKIKKVTSGSNKKSSIVIDKLYSSIITAGTFMASSIKVAEASKSIENAQRDLNISFVNELAIIFDRLGIDTNEVIEAASTKWNFLKFKPGLVGGHCIGVDPYYLTHKAEELGYFPKVIHSGRSVNENMSSFIVQKFLKCYISNNLTINNSRVLILGITFKENCSDIRNSRIVDVHKQLSEYGYCVDVYDPNANKNEVFKEFNINLIDDIKFNHYDGVILAVSHQIFKSLNWDNITSSKKSVIFDLKNFIDKDISTIRL